MRLRASPASEFQAVKTRAVLGLQMFRQMLISLLAVWIVLTTAVVWYQIGVYFPRLDHVYFGRWIVCSILGETPFLNRFTWWIWLPLNGTDPKLAVISAWLAGPQMYRHTFYQAFWHAAGHGWGLAADLVPVSLVAWLSAWRWRRDPDGGEHIRGLRLLTARQLCRQIYGSWLQQLCRRAPLERGIQLGGIAIPKERESEHFMMVGKTGSGKTTVIRGPLRQIRERQQRAIVQDPESDLVQEFYDPDRGDVILNSFDTRCPFWSPWLEFHDDTLAMDLEAMAAALIRTPPRDATQEFFFRTGRKLLKCLFSVIETHEPQAIFELLSQPLEQIQARLEGTVAYRLVDPDLKETGHNIIGTALTAASPFEHLPRSTEAAIQPMQAIWFDCLVRQIMDDAIGGEQIWVIADELAALDYQPNILTLLTRGRKRGKCAVLGFQSVAQLQTIYGRGGANTISSQPTTKLILGTDEPETARWSSDAIGSHEIERLQITQLAGRADYREGVNLSPHRSIEPLVLSSEIQRLAPLRGYLCVWGYDRCMIQIPKLPRVSNHPDFILRGQAMPLAPVQRPEDFTAHLPKPTEIDEPSDEEIVASLMNR